VEPNQLHLDDEPEFKLDLILSKEAHSYLSKLNGRAEAA
jgi:hypothetical protein